MAFLNRHLIAVAAALSLALPGVVCDAAAASRSALTEAQAKAGFLYNCAMFISWPPAASGRSDMVIAIVGDDTVASIIHGMQGREVNGRVLRIKRLNANDDLSGVHIVFVGGGDSRAATALIDRLGEAAVLTVGEHADFTRKGGVVRLYTDNDRLRFEINMTRVERAGLKVSAKMLGLAKIVR